MSRAGCHVRDDARRPITSVDPRDYLTIGCVRRAAYWPFVLPMGAQAGSDVRLSVPAAPTRDAVDGPGASACQASSSRTSSCVPHRCKDQSTAERAEKRRECDIARSLRLPNDKSKTAMDAKDAKGAKD